MQPEARKALLLLAKLAFKKMWERIRERRANRKT
jgi:hypothetical protein